MIFFETGDISARTLRQEDAKRFHALCTQPSVLQWMDDWDMTLPQTEGLVRHYIKGYAVNDPQRHPFLMAIWHKPSEELIGICGFGPKEELNGQPKIAYFPDARHTQRGYMTQVVEKAIDHYFTHFNKPALYALVDDRNLPSKKILLHHGFQKVESYASNLPTHYRRDR
ncbi:MAG TPA: GNAT family N-acetyltransferase [Clostridia bacterium]|nr:GNAT family N-acetyltransferase [Clostridia bacterium]